MAAGLPLRVCADCGRAAPRPGQASWSRTSRSRCRTRTRCRPTSSGRPASCKKNSAAGVLFLHWLGEINNDRGEYLTEAITLAGQGVVSVLPAGLLPVGAQPGRHRPATSRWSRTRWPRCARRSTGSRRSRGVDKTRIALVGHDYGAMYGALLAAVRPPRVGDGARGAGRPDGQLVRAVLAAARGPGAGGLPRAVRRPGPRGPHRPPRVARALPVGRRGLLHRPGGPRRLRRQRVRTPR